MSNTVLITGASSGIGRELAVLFGRAGDRWGKLYLNGRSRERLNETADRFRGEPFAAECDLVIADLTDNIQDVRMSAFCSDVLILAADAKTARPLTFADAGIGLISSFLSGRAAAQKGGQIVYLNSVAGLQASNFGDEGFYSMGKFAMTGYLKSLTPHLASCNPKMPIRVLDVFLNACRTPMTQDRPDHEYLIDPADAARAIYDVVAHPMLSAQITELHIGRLRFPTEQG